MQLYNAGGSPIRSRITCSKQLSDALQVRMAWSHSSSAAPPQASALAMTSMSLQAGSWSEVRSACHRVLLQGGKS